MKIEIIYQIYIKNVNEQYKTNSMGFCALPKYRVIDTGQVKYLGKVFPIK